MYGVFNSQSHLVGQFDSQELAVARSIEWLEKVHGEKAVSTDRNGWIEVEVPGQRDGLAIEHLRHNKFAWED